MNLGCCTWNFMTKFPSLPDDAITKVGELGFEGFELFDIQMELTLYNQIGINGAIVQTISHGLIISLLFFSIGIIHTTKGTRSIKELNSMMDNSPRILTNEIIFKFPARFSGGSGTPFQIRLS